MFFEKLFAKKECKERISGNSQKRIQRRSENHRVAGMSYRKSEIKSLAFEADEWSWPARDLKEFSIPGERVYQYNFPQKEVELVPDLDNEYDKNAIKVIVDGVHVGFIKKGSTGRVRNLMQEHNGKATIEIKGGKYKQVVEDYETLKKTIERGEESFHATITITYDHEEEAK